jgi:hypothetical protein
VKRGVIGGLLGSLIVAASFVGAGPALAQLQQGAPVTPGTAPIAPGSPQPGSQPSSSPAPGATVTPAPNSTVTPAPADQQQPQASQAAPSQTAPGETLQPGQLDALLAPIALYPDSLLGQILMAATYPLEVVEAERWVADPNNAALTGDALTAALGQQSWDPSVKSLVPFPQILKMMSGRLDWTQQIGDAFLAQQADVMASVQRLRHEAQAAGKLASTPQESVTMNGSDIVIAPPDGQVYVPYYDPSAVYGDWPYPDYPPYEFPPWAGIIYPPGFAIGFGFGVGIDAIGPYWGWDSFDWGNNGIYIDSGRYSRINGGRSASFSGNHWAHDPTHRRGVPYRSSTTAARFGRSTAAAPAATRAYRGYATPSTGTRGYAAPNNAGLNFGARGFATTPSRRTTRTPSVIRPESTTRPSYFGGYGAGNTVRSQSQRGATSLQSMHSFSAPRASAPHFSAPRASAPHFSAPHGAPSGGGGRRR